MGSPDLWDEPVLPFSVLRHIAQDLNLTGQDSYCLCLDHVLAFGREWGTLSDSPGSLHAMVAGSVPTENGWRHGYHAKDAHTWIYSSRLSPERHR